MKYFILLFVLSFATKTFTQAATIDLPSEPEVEMVSEIAEEMPRFPGCEKMKGTIREKEMCAREKMFYYIIDNLKYPKKAKENGTEGTVVVKFVVAKDGSIRDARIVRNLKDGCGESALAMVVGMNNMPERWTPGKQNNQNVAVKYTLPVNFRL